VLANSDISISTSEHEFFGISVMEAYARGCHIVVPNRLSYPELYRGRSGVTFYEDENGLFDALVHLLESKEIIKGEADSLSWDEQNTVKQIDKIIFSILNL
jgi:glycosyltransferase involved in cell wall biosynthesis